MPLVVHYWTDLQSRRGLRCYGNITRTRNVSEYMLVLALCPLCVSPIFPACLADNNDVASSEPCPSVRARVKRSRKLRPRRTHFGLHCGVKSTLNVCRAVFFIAGSWPPAACRRECQPASYGGEIVIVGRLL